jgi:hypothetical protein
MRVQFLLEEGQIDRAICLLQTGYEFNAPDMEEVDSEALLKLDMKPILEPVELLAVCEYLCVWLFEVIDDSVKEEDRQG